MKWFFVSRKRCESSSYETVLIHSEPSTKTKFTTSIAYTQQKQSSQPHQIYDAKLNSQIGHKFHEHLQSLVALQVLCVAKRNCSKQIDANNLQVFNKTETYVIILISMKAECQICHKKVQHFTFIHSLLCTIPFQFKEQNSPNK